MREPELVASSSAAVHGAMEGVLDAVEEVRPDRGLDEALDEHVREQGTSTIVARSRELSGLYWLDSILVLLSLGHMGILMHAAALTSACVTTAFLLAPRRVGDGLASAGPASRHTAVEPASQAGGTGALMPRCERTECEPQHESAGAEPTAPGAPAAQHAVLPALQAHWAALGQVGLPASEAVELTLGFVAWASERRCRVECVLDAYGVPLELRDGSNLVSGLVAVRPEALPKGQLSVARREAAPSTWSISGLAAAVGAALPSINAEAFAADVIAGRPALLGAQGACIDSAPLVVSDVCELTAAALALPATMAVPVALAMPDATAMHGGATQAIHGLASATAIEEGGAANWSASAPATIDRKGALMMAINRHGGFQYSNGHQERKRRELQQSGAHRLLVPMERDVREYLNFALAVGCGWPDHLAALLSRATLHIYVDWVVEPDGRLHSLHQGQTHEELRAAISSDYRLPAEAVMHVAHHLLAHPREVESAALCGGRMCIVDPGGHAAGVASSSLPSAKMLRKAKTGLNLHAEAFGAGHVAHAEELARAYDMSLRELNRQARRCVPALLPAVRCAIFARLDLQSPHHLRLALWIALATRLKTRTYEGISLLHADLVLDASDRSVGEWLVGARTKTTDGVDGRVTGWDHRMGCELAGCTMHELLSVHIDVLRRTACGCCDGAPSYDRLCHICLTVLVRRIEANVDEVGYAPIFQAIDSCGEFDGRGECVQGEGAV